MRKSVLKKIYEDGFCLTRSYFYYADSYYGDYDEFCRVFRFPVEGSASYDQSFSIAKKKFGPYSPFDYILFGKKEVNPDGAQIQGSSCS